MAAVGVEDVVIIDVVPAGAIKLVLTGVLVAIAELLGNEVVREATSTEEVWCAANSVDKDEMRLSISRLEDV